MGFFIKFQGFFYFPWKIKQVNKEYLRRRSVNNRNKLTMCRANIIATSLFSLTFIEGAGSYNEFRKI